MLKYFHISGSIQFSCSVVCDSLRPHGLQHSRPPCPSPTPGPCSNSCPWVGDAIQPSHPLSSPSSPTFNLSQDQGLFKWVSSSHQVAQVLELQLQNQSFQRIFWLISFKIDTFDLFAVQGTLKSLLHNHSLKSSILQCSTFMVQLSHHTWLLDKPKLWLDGPLLAEWCLCFLIPCLGLS